MNASAHVVDDDVDEPGAERGLLVLLLLVLHVVLLNGSWWWMWRSVDGGQALGRGLVSERDEARLHGGLVAVRFVDAAELVIRGDRAAAGTNRNEGAVATFLPRRERFESRRRLGACCFLA